MFSLAEYLDWGYLGRETLINKSTAGTLRPETRREILKELLKSNSRINAREYWEACERRLSLRQAERDLQGSDLVRPLGRTKGRIHLRRG